MHSTTPGVLYKEKRKGLIGVVSDHYAALILHFVGKALSFSPSANCHAAAQNILVFSPWPHLKTRHNTAGLALSTANRHRIYSTLKVTEQSFPSEWATRGKAAFSARDSLLLPDTWQCHLLLFFLPPN